MTYTRTFTFLAALASLAAGCGQPSGTPADLALTGVTVVDVASGTLTPGRTIVVTGDRIVAVGDSAAGFAPARTVDATGRFAMPGLWDMHVHFGGGEALIAENRNLLPLYVAHGITTVRDAAGDLSPSVLEWRAAVAAGTLQGPSIFTSGPKLEGINSVWPGDLEVGSEAEVQAALDKLQAMRVDFVKITENTLTPALYMYGLREATKRGFATSAHVPVAVTLDQASEAGLRSIEHMSYLLRGGSPREAELSAAVAAGTMTAADATTAMIDSFDDATALQTYQRLAKRGTAVTPTLNGSRILAYLDQDTHVADSDLQYLGAGLKATYEGRVTRAAGDDAAAVARRHERFEKAARLLPLLQKAGVTILAGTDAGFLNSFNYPGIGLHDELDVLVRYGLTPQQALAASVVQGPAFLGKASDFGALIAGKQADILVLDRNPLEDIRATRAIYTLVLRGKALDRAALDALLADAKTRAAATSAPR
ncbi:MAG: amidohydrolase family protein [Acidobacteria bacterium]|nr:amidohydrolase family protein [Acidobacteriota bacterium]